MLDCSAIASAELDGGARASPTAAPEPWLWERSPDGLRTYAALAGVLALGSLPALRSQQLTDLPYFISLAVITIYVGEQDGALQVCPFVTFCWLRFTSSGKAIQRQKISADRSVMRQAAIGAWDAKTGSPLASER